MSKATYRIVSSVAGSNIAENISAERAAEIKRDWRLTLALVTEWTGFRSEIWTGHGGQIKLTESRVG